MPPEIQTGAEEARQVYPSLHEDPAYKNMSVDVTKQTNADSAVMTAMRDGRAQGAHGYEQTWDRVNTRETIHGWTRFIAQHPEKASGYADRWREYVQENPQVADMSNGEWDRWCDDHPTGDMGERRMLARILEQKQRNADLKAMTKAASEQRNPARNDSNVPLRQLSDSEMADTARRMNSLQAGIDELYAVSVRELNHITASPELQNATDAELADRQKNLALLPYFPGQKMQYVLDFEGKKLERLQAIQLHQIVGSVSLAFDDWSSEYDNRKRRAVSVAKRLPSDSQVDEDYIFHPGEPTKQIKLKMITGPAGPMYWVVDGSHRVAGAKLAEVAVISAQVEDMSELKEVTTPDAKLAREWEARIKRGLIEGRVTQKKNGEFKLEITKQVLPWMHIPTDDLVEFNRFYESIYPGSLAALRTLRGASIPFEVLTHIGKFEEYVRGDP